MRGQERITSNRRAHLTVTQDKVWQDGEDRFTCRTLNTPDGHATETDPRIVRVTGQAPAPTTGGLMCELKAEGQDEGEDTFDKRFAVTKELKIDRFVPKIDGDGPVFVSPFGCLSHVLPSVLRSRKLRRHHRGNALKSQAYCEELRVPPLNSVECEKCQPGGRRHRAGTECVYVGHCPGGPADSIERDR